MIKNIYKIKEQFLKNVSIFMCKISTVLQKAIQERKNNTSDGAGGDGGVVCVLCWYFSKLK